MGKLADALRHRFKTPQEALKALGLDAALLNSKENEMTVKVLSPRAVVARGALMEYMRPRLAADAQINYGPLLDGVTAKNFGERQSAIAAALRKAVAGKLAADADVEDVEEVLDAIGGFKDEIVNAVESQTDDLVPPDDDQQLPPDDDKEATDSPEMLAKVLEFLKGRLSPEDMNELTEMVGREEQITEDPDDEAARLGKEDDEPAVDEVVEVPLKEKDMSGAMDAAIKKARAGLVTQTAMDAAIKQAVEKTRSEMATQAQEVQEATRAIRPYVGELAMDANLDTADKIYAKALSVLGVPSVDKIHPSAYPALLSAQPKLGARQSGQRQAQDAIPAGVKSFAERFPNAARVQTV